MCIKFVLAASILAVSGCTTTLSGSAYKVEMSYSDGASERISIVALVSDGTGILNPPPFSSSTDIAWLYNWVTTSTKHTANGCVVFGTSGKSGGQYLYFDKSGKTMRATLYQGIDFARVLELTILESSVIGKLKEGGLDVYEIELVGTLSRTKDVNECHELLERKHT